MGKKSKQAKQQNGNTEVTQATAQTEQAAPVKYTVVPPKRPLTGVRYGVSGNAFTHHALADAAKQNGGALTWPEIQAVCAGCSHKGFAAYALNRLHVLVPVAAAAS